MKYIKAINIWDYSDAVRKGQIKLQKGQWVRLGEGGRLSRYHSTNGNTIRAFHYPNATKKFRAYEASMKESEALMKAAKEARAAARGAAKLPGDGHPGASVLPHGAGQC